MESDLSALTIVPANQASCEDLFAVFGQKGYTARCLCQRFRTTGEEWWHDPIPRGGAGLPATQANRLRLPQVGDDKRVGGLPGW